MDNEEIKKTLEQSLEWEDQFVLSYDKDFIWELLRSLGDNKFKRIEPLLRENIADTQKHRDMLKEILEKIKNGEYAL